MNRKLRIAQALMVASILLIAAVQTYWLTRLYSNEKEDMKRETDVIFRDAVYKLQVSRFKKDTLIYKMIDSLPDNNLFNIQGVTTLINKTKTSNTQQKVIKDTGTRVTHTPATRKIIMVNNELVPDSITRRMLSPNDSSPAFVQVYFRGDKDTMEQLFKGAKLSQDVMARVLHITKSDSLRSVAHITTVPRSKQLSLSKAAITNRPIQIEAIHDDLSHPTRIFTNSKTVNDSLPLREVDSAFHADLKKAGINLQFTLLKSIGSKPASSSTAGDMTTEPASVGFLTPYYYQATFANPGSYLLQKMMPQVSFTLLLVAFTIISFVVLYRNMMSQKKLADIKNEFISNITHELKTPIATVNVAIEAMQNFNVLQNPERTKEYLDISAMELQRLSLLVDKVLRLSMFEKREIELKKQTFDIYQLVREVMMSMKLQFEKSKADVSITTKGDGFNIHADKLHITSVIYNLLDNALKYSRTTPVIKITITDKKEEITLAVQDNGIGIPSAYKVRIFEKFFRVPANDTHNIKGYGLGLSYVSHIVQSHNGSITVDSVQGTGSTFIIQLPKQLA